MTMLTDPSPTPDPWAEMLRVINDQGADLTRERLRANLVCLRIAVEAKWAAERQQATAQGWRCFHCDEVFTDKAEAHEHFGDYPDDNPACLIKGADGGLIARIRALEGEVAEALNQRNEYENDARLWHEAEADRVRRIGNVQWWQELDSREGQRLVLEAEVASLTQQLTEARHQIATLEEHHG